MPRNSSGTYSLPEPPFVTQTTISSTVMNSQLSDIASNLTTSAASTGVTPLTGGLKGIVSTTVAYAFDGDATTGFGSSVAGETYIKSAGTTIVSITATGISITGTLATTGGFSGTISTSGATAAFIGFEATSTDADAAAGPSFSGYRNSASVAANDFITSYDFYGKDSAANKTLYARIVAQIIDATDGSEDASVFIQALVAGALSSRIGITAAGVDTIGTLTATVGVKVGANATATPGKTPTNQEFTSGTGTYVSSAGATWIKVRAVGGGGGGGGNTGGATGGTNTLFNGIQANPGSGGVNGSGSTGGVGGAGGSSGGGSANLRLPGARGGDGGFSSNSSSGNGGEGGATPFGGYGGSSNTTGYNAVANSGSGGSGSGNNGYGSGGGGAGEYMELILAAGSYSYTVGAGGAPATNGGAGAAGRIYVEEYYS